MICHCITKVGRREHGKWVSIFLGNFGNPKRQHGGPRQPQNYLEKAEQILEKPSRKVRSDSPFWGVGAGNPRFWNLELGRQSSLSPFAQSQKGVIFER